MCLGITIKESDLKADFCCSWAITNGWGGEAMGP